MTLYTVRKVNGFVNETKEYTGNKTTPWVVNRYVYGYAVMIDNRMVEVYPTKNIAKMAADALNSN